MKQNKTDKQRLCILAQTLFAWRKYEAIVMGISKEHIKEQIDALEWAIYELKNKGKGYGR